MRTRGEARREEAAAEGQHAALLSAAERYVTGGLEAVEEGTLELETALAAVGPPGSPPLLAALAHGDHALLRKACNQWPYDAVPPLLRAYGEAPDALACMAEALAADGIPLYRLIPFCHAEATAALLGAYRRAGRAHEALAAGNHAALRGSACHPDVLALLLAEYGEPGSDAVLAALASGGHDTLTSACLYGSAQAAALVAAAYGPPGCAALRGALASTLPLLFKFMSVPADEPHALPARLDATLAALLAALGEPDCASALRQLGAWLEAPKDNYYRASVTPAQRLARIPRDSLLARLAAATPQTWALNPDAARALLSAPVRSSLALPALLALRRLPGGVAAPVAAHLRARPWLLFSGAAASAPAAAAPPPA
jgi:hypothetical protein